MKRNQETRKPWMTSKHSTWQKKNTCTRIMLSFFIVLIPSIHVNGYFLKLCPRHPLCWNSKERKQVVIQVLTYI